MGWEKLRYNSGVHPVTLLGGLVILHRDYSSKETQTRTERMRIAGDRQSGMALEQNASSRFERNHRTGSDSGNERWHRTRQLRH